MHITASIKLWGRVPMFNWLGYPRELRAPLSKLREKLKIDHRCPNANCEMIDRTFGPTNTAQKVREKGKKENERRKNVTSTKARNMSYHKNIYARSQLPLRSRSPLAASAGRRVDSGHVPIS